MNTDNYTEKDFNELITALQKKIILDRLILGFNDDPNKKYSSEEMMEKAIELEVYKNIKKHVQNKKINRAWIDFYNENKADIKLVNNKNDYKNIFMNVYIKEKFYHLSPNKIIDYIKEEEIKLRKGEYAIG